MHDFNNRQLYGNNIYRDINLLFICDKKNNQWYGTNSNLLLEPTYFATKQKGHFNAVKFFTQFYGIEKKGTGFVVGTLEERQKLNSENRGYLMPFIPMNDNVSIARNKEFYGMPIGIKKRDKAF